jgi:hypothetical protein
LLLWRSYERELYDDRGYDPFKLGTLQSMILRVGMYAGALDDAQKMALCELMSDVTGQINLSIGAANFFHGRGAYLGPRC